MKLLSILFLALITISTAYGQKPGKASLGAEIGIPTGSGSEGVNTGFGGSLRYEGLINSHVTWQAYIGYIYFTASANLIGVNVSGHESIIPIMGGVKYYPTESFNGFYFGGDIGVSAISATVSVPGYGSLTGSQNNFTFSPNMGYHFSGFDLTVRYNLISDSNYVGIRAAFTF